MPYTPHEQLRDFEGKFHAYETAFPTVHGRQRFVWDLVEGKVNPEYNLSQLQLAAHWGHERDPLKALAFFIYGLKIATDKNLGQPFIVLHQGSIEDVMSDTDELQKPVRASFGSLLDEKGLIHRFGGSIHKKHGPPGGIKPPYIRTTVEIPTTMSYELSMDAEDPSENYVGLEGDETIPVYTALLPLDSDRYGHVGRTRESYVVIGSGPCREVFEAMQHKGLPNVAEEIGFDIAA